MKPVPFERGSLPIGMDVASVARRIEMLEQLLERAFVIPGTNKRVGLDAIIGLLPVAGDTVAALMGLYLVWEARNLGMSKWHLARMIGNVGFDWLVGLVPVAGDVLDFFIRSNSRNMKIIRKHLDKHHPGLRTIEG
jgi:hypothetical protein